MKKIKIKIKNLTKLNNHITNLSKLKKQSKRFCYTEIEKRRRIFHLWLVFSLQNYFDLIKKGTNFVLLLISVDQKFLV